jgi:PAS domain S-box-containing protein
MLSVNNNPTNQDIGGLVKQLISIYSINNHYVIKENILFPLLEKEWDDYQCLKLMWSFHDDIRRGVKECISILKQEVLDVKLFNSVSGKLYFDIFTIIHREEKVLVPLIDSTIEMEILREMLLESKELGFSLIADDEIALSSGKSLLEVVGGTVKLSTGGLSLEQLELIFKYLPVDMTFVDENDTVLFYSDPPHRIFPRTKAIIGRKVQNCHPPESVDVVERIVKAFRDGEKNDASFWIKMGPKLVLIRYFAMRDEDGNFRGTLEVSQEVSDIRQLEGERRLLDWD